MTQDVQFAKLFRHFVMKKTNFGDGAEVSDLIYDAFGTITSTNDNDTTTPTNVALNKNEFAYNFCATISVSKF